jgi:succinate dehydrogenase / fumarate reductase cytochrome b subunit
MKSLVQRLSRFYASSIGKKIIVALTGVVLVGFLVGHLLGNLLIYGGPEPVNDYAEKLRRLGPGLWLIRGGLLLTLVAHIVATVHLTAQNRKARPDPNVVETVFKASWSSRIMIWSGLTILAFVIYHLMHFTWGTFNDFWDPDGPYFLADGRHNVHAMVVAGFREFGNSAFYAVALFLLCSHIGHGVASMFQTLGLTTPGSRRLIAGASWGFAMVIFAGYVSIPIAILAGWVR